MISQAHVQTGMLIIKMMPASIGTMAAMPGLTNTCHHQVDMVISASFTILRGMRIPKNINWQNKVIAEKASDAFGNWEMSVTA